MNYWHDMVFDHRYVSYRLARAIAGLDQDGPDELSCGARPDRGDA